MEWKMINVSKMLRMIEIGILILIDEESQLIDEDRPIMMTMMPGWIYLLGGGILVVIVRIREIEDTMIVMIEEEGHKLI
jgi:hypothetical protein